jgi:hypothetical protein
VGLVTRGLLDPARRNDREATAQALGALPAEYLTVLNAEIPIGGDEMCQGGCDAQPSADCSSADGISFGKRVNFQ